MDAQEGTIHMKDTVVDVNAIAPQNEGPSIPQSIEELIPHDVTPAMQEALRQMLAPYHDVFTWAGQPIGRTSVFQHTIDTGDAHPRRQPSRRIPLHHRKEVDKLIDSLLAQDVVRPSTSPWASAVTLVKKKDNSLRFCIDYRPINGLTEKDPFPIPRMDEMLAALAGKRFFATLDLSSSYWQIEVAPEDRHKTAFLLLSGLYEFNLLPMGMVNAAATCQRAMQSILEGLTRSMCLVYLDDVIIFEETAEELLNNV